MVNSVGKPDSPVDVMTRRQFVGAAALTVSNALPIPTSASEASSSGSAGDYDVIIIGGGFCGITAARECRHMGYRTLVLEARNRLGGRTFTADFEGRPVDLGGAWVHWSQPYVWAEIRRSGVPLQETMSAKADRLILHTSSHDIVTLSSTKIGTGFERACAEYMGDTRTELPLPHDPFGSEEFRKLDGITSAERLASLKGMSGLYRDLLDASMAGQGHNYTDQFAWLEMVRWYSLPGHNMSDMDDMSSRFHFRDGTVSLLNALLVEGKPDVRLGTPVRRVVEGDDRVHIVTTRGEELSSRAVISTVPLNVLKDIEWQPVLSEAKLQASRATHAGRGTKVHVLVEGDYGNLNGAAPSRNALNSLGTEDIFDGHTYLIGFGPDLELLDVNDVESVQSAVRLFLPNAKVIKTFGYHWALDPYAKGTWCTLRPHMWSRYLRELQQPSARIIFGSADWANGYRGFIDGAIEQGLEAGRRVKVLLG